MISHAVESVKHCIIAHATDTSTNQPPFAKMTAQFETLTVRSANVAILWGGWLTLKVSIRPRAGQGSQEKNDASAMKSNNQLNVVNLAPVGWAVNSVWLTNGISHIPQITRFDRSSQQYEYNWNRHTYIIWFAKAYFCQTAVLL